MTGGDGDAASIENLVLVGLVQNFRVWFRKQTGLFDFGSVKIKYVS